MKHAESPLTTMAGLFKEKIAVYQGSHSDSESLLNALKERGSEILVELFNQTVADLSEADILKLIPSINGASDLTAFDKQIVRFTGMVQENEEASIYYPVLKKGEDILFNPLDDDSDEGLEVEESVCFGLENMFAIAPPSMTQWASDLQSGQLNHKGLENITPQCVGILVPQEKEEKVIPINEIVEFYGYFTVNMQEPESSGPDAGIFAMDEAVMAEMKIKQERRKNSLMVFKTEKQGGSLTDSLLRGAIGSPVTAEFLKSHEFMQGCADKLRQIFTNILGGDAVAAEFLFLNLVSKYYQSKETILFDNFPVNLYGFTPEDIIQGSDDSLVEVLAQAIGWFKEYSLRLPFSLKFLNTTPAVPKKNYDTGILDTGFLQQANSSHIVVNEVMLDEGHLNEQGVKGLFAIKQIMSKQELEYDFQYMLSFKTNYSFLVLSQGRSLLKSPELLEVRLAPTRPATAESLHSLNESDIWKLRCYFRYLRLGPVKIALKQEDGTWATEKYCEMRKLIPEGADESKFMASPDFLSQWLTMARIRAFAEGKYMIDQENLEACLKMKEEVFERKQLYDEKMKGKA